ncbi:MAG: hypothetical protein RL001_2328 [Pseudomonadota bacterium]|jgi:Glutaredoxin-like domain (DUF836)|nr:glutaredoxin family protein [Oxalobacteraceae bacterium]
MIHFILYSRSYCHLCDDMLSALKTLAGEEVPVTVIDIDDEGNEALLARYDELVPVLIGQRVGQPDDQPDQQLCHYFLNENTVRDFLSKA